LNFQKEVDNTLLNLQKLHLIHQCDQNYPKYLQKIKAHLEDFKLIFKFTLFIYARYRNLQAQLIYLQVLLQNI